VSVHETLGAEGKGRDVEKLLKGDRGLGEENGVGRGLSEVPGDGPVRVFKADGEVGEGGRLPPSSDSAGFMDGATFLEGVKGHNVCGKLVLGDRDSSRMGGTSVSDETSECEISSGPSDQLAVLPIDETTEYVHGKGLGWEGSRGMHADNDITIPADADADEFSVVV